MRYFNAAGADPEGRAGERHEPESHLIPIILQVAAGMRQHISIFGSDYETTNSRGEQDGTCVRDYIHMTDLCAAHTAALCRLWGGKASGHFNLGNGTGYSVQEVIEAVAHVTGKEIPVVKADRRAGDPGTLIAKPDLAMKSVAEGGLGWKPVKTLDQIVDDAWRFMQQQQTKEAEAEMTVVEATASSRRKVLYSLAAFGAMVAVAALCKGSGSAPKR